MSVALLSTMLSRLKRFRCPRQPIHIIKVLPLLLLLIVPWLVGVRHLFNRATNLFISQPHFQGSVHFRRAPIVGDSDSSNQQLLRNMPSDFAASGLIGGILIPGYPDGKKKPLVSIAAPSRSRESWNNLDDTEVVNSLIPSLVRTITDLERSRFRFRLYLSVDDDDIFWKAQREKIQLRAPAWLKTEVLVFEKSYGGKAPDLVFKIPFNQMMRKVYSDGADFMVRINDDTEFGSSDWVTKGIAMLASYDPPFVGVVGAIEKNTKGIYSPPDLLPHDFTHRVHMDIFKRAYYPEVFSNWYIDDWITRVYGKERTTKLQDWLLYHHANSPRYDARTDQQVLLAPALATGQNMINAWLRGKCEKCGAGAAKSFHPAMVVKMPQEHERKPGKNSWRCLTGCSCSAGNQQ